jgi:hypothetical protein
MAKYWWRTFNRKATSPNTAINFSAIKPGHSGRSDENENQLGEIKNHDVEKKENENEIVNYEDDEIPLKKIKNQSGEKTENENEITSQDIGGIPLKKMKNGNTGEKEKEITNDDTPLEGIKNGNTGEKEKEKRTSKLLDEIRKLKTKFTKRGKHVMVYDNENENENENENKNGQQPYGVAHMVTQLKLCEQLEVIEVAVTAMAVDKGNDGNQPRVTRDDDGPVPCQCCGDYWAKHASKLCCYCQQLAPFWPLTTIFDDVDVSGEFDGEQVAADKRIIEINAIKQENDDIRLRHMQRKLSWARTRARGFIQYDDSNVIHAEHLFGNTRGEPRVNLDTAY